MRHKVGLLTVHKGELLNPVGQSLNPVVGRHCRPLRILAKPLNIITQRDLSEHQKMAVSYLKALLPRGPLILPTLNTNSNHVVIEIDVFVCAPGFSNFPTGFNNSLHELDDSDTKLISALIDTLGRSGTLVSLRQSFSPSDKPYPYPDQQLKTSHFRTGLLLIRQIIMRPGSCGSGGTHK